MYRESLKSANHVARSKREACLWKTIYRRSTEGQKNLNNSKAPASCCLTLEPEKQGAGKWKQTAFCQTSTNNKIYDVFSLKN